MQSSQLALLVLVSVFCSSQAIRDYYKVLGVEKNDNLRKIKRSYHKLVLKYHPDKNKDKEAAEKFMEIVDAYETLRDDDKRALYNSMGHDAYVSSQRGGRQQSHDQYNRQGSSHHHSWGQGSFEEDFFKQWKEHHSDFFRDDFFSKFGADDDGGFFDNTDFQHGDGPVPDLGDFMTWSDGGESHFGTGQTFFGGGHFRRHRNNQHFEAHQHQHQQHQQQHKRQQGRPFHKHFSLFDDNDIDFDDASNNFEDFFFDGPSMFESSSGPRGSSFSFSSTGSKTCQTVRHTDGNGRTTEKTSCSFT